MRVLIFAFSILFSLTALAEERVQYSRVYLLTGVANVDKSANDDTKTSEWIQTIGASFRIGDFAHMGMYYSTNNHYGWMGGFDLDDSSRLRLMIGNTDKTDMPVDETVDPFVPYQEPDEKVYTFGAGFDYSISRGLGLTIQGFTYDSGNDTQNYEVSAGITFSF